MDAQRLFSFGVAERSEAVEGRGLMCSDSFQQVSLSRVARGFPYIFATF
jgi:hypothetical protein